MIQVLAQGPTPSQRKCPDLGPSLEALHLAAASWKGIQVLWGDKAMPRRPAWLTRASFPTPLRPSDLCCARLPLRVPTCGGAACAAPVSLLSCRVAMLVFPLQNSGVIPAKGRTESGLLFIFWHLQGSGPFGNKSALHLQAVADTLGWICSPVSPHLSGFPCNPKGMVTAPCSDK